MKTKKLSSFFACLIFSISVQAQLDGFEYRRALEGISGTWHRIEIPDDLFSNSRTDLADLRVFGITGSPDTIEAPYLLRNLADEQIVETANFKILNQGLKDGKQYFTFENQETKGINRLNLQFSEKNFDWKANLEGSNDQLEWFEILKDYRILSIVNEQADYAFTQMQFPEVKYRYLRLSVPSAKRVKLESASLDKRTTKTGTYRDYQVALNTTQEKTQKRTILNLETPLAVPVSRLKLDVKADYDYHRTIQVSWLADSTQTSAGIIYNYKPLFTGTLSSLESGEFSFQPTVCKKLQITILNMDNEPLNIEKVTLSGPVFELVARFIEKADYYLFYGNKKLGSPNYDIKKFSSNIPAEVSVLKLGTETAIGSAKVATKPLFGSKYWLWGIIILVMGLLGWFTLKMMRESN